MNNMTELIGRKPKNVIIADTIRGQINSGTLPVGERLLSDDDFARKYKINKRTVAAGLNALVKEGLLERIPRQGTFVVNNDSGGHKTSNAVGMVMLSKGDNYSDINRNIAKGLSKHKLFPVLINNDVIFDNTSIITFLNSLNAEYAKPYGFIIDGNAEFPFSFLKEHIKKFNNIVFVNRYLYCEKLGESKYATVDFREAGRIAAKHLIAQGHKKLAYLTKYERYRGGEWSSMRLPIMHGFAEVCREHNVEFNEKVFWKLLRGAPHIEVIKDLIASPDCPDAIFAQSDAFIRYELLPLLENKKNIELIGFYNTHHAEECGFSSICVHEEKIAENAIKLLTNKNKKQEKILIKPELIIRSQ